MLSSLGAVRMELYSCLGASGLHSWSPLLLLYIKDKVNETVTIIRLLADDISLFVIVENRITVAKILNDNLQENFNLG